MSFFQKLIQHMANDVIVSRLARSKTFQDAAYKTHTAVSELKKQAADQGTKLGTEFREGLTKAQKEARATEAVQEAKRLQSGVQSAKDEASSTWGGFRKYIQDTKEGIKKDLADDWKSLENDINKKK